MSQQKRPRDEEPHRYAMNAVGEWVHVIDAIVGDTYRCDCPKPHLLEVFESEFVHADKQPSDPNKVWTLQTKFEPRLKKKSATPKPTNGKWKHTAKGWLKS